MGSSHTPLHLQLLSIIYYLLTKLSSIIYYLLKLSLPSSPYASFSESKNTSAKSIVENGLNSKSMIILILQLLLGNRIIPTCLVGISMLNQSLFPQSRQLFLHSGGRSSQKFSYLLRIQSLIFAHHNIQLLQALA